MAWLLGKDKVSKPQGMANGRNALQGVSIMVLINPLKNKAARTLEDENGDIQMVGRKGAEGAQKDVKVDAVKQANEAEDKGLKYPLKRHPGKYGSQHRRFEGIEWGCCGCKDRKSTYCKK